jgi:hypothetical protein
MIEGRPRRTLISTLKGVELVGIDFGISDKRRTHPRCTDHRGVLYKPTDSTFDDSWLGTLVKRRAGTSEM